MCVCSCICVCVFVTVAVCGVSFDDTSSVHLIHPSCCKRVSALSIASCSLNQSPIKYKENTTNKKYKKHNNECSK